MESILSFVGLGVLILVGSYAVAKARRLLNDEDARMSDLAAFRTMEDAGEFDRDEAKRVHLAIQTRFNR